jgi:hypothetical protein
MAASGFSRPVQRAHDRAAATGMKAWSPWESVRKKSSDMDMERGRGGLLQAVCHSQWRTPCEFRPDSRDLAWRSEKVRY